ncbi:CHAT domain-containing protein [Hymenobacter sp. CRA2]|uniref:CHAT domain-containing protein n=1 Tax=Hymenobacter sp. CRA2 TaxID=1955620 RepID=UPI001592A58E|nr:CHAT domain-containing protein [Hymenobacter sp. CRA2]
MAPGPDVPPAPEQRQLLVQTQEQVRIAQDFALTVQVATEARPAGPHEAAAPVPEGFAGQLLIDVRAPGLELTTGSSQTLDVPPRGNSQPIRFGLKASKAGSYTISIDAWNGAAHIASVEVVVAVEQPARPVAPDEPGPAGGSAQANAILRNPEQGEYTLVVDYEADEGQYTFRLQHETAILAPVQSPPLVGTRQEILGGLTRMMNDLARNTRAYSDEQARDWLEGMGALMFRQLLPERLQKDLWQARHSMQRLNLIAPADQMPWEILFLSDPEPAPGSDEPGVFLADATVVVRWLYGDGAPTTIRRAPAYVVIPPNAPPQAQQELASVERVCGKPALVSDLDGLRQLTRNGAFRWLHFAAHNLTLPDQIGTSYIPFGQQAFSLPLMASIPLRRYATDQPLVFMNACTTAGQQPLFTEMGGWADTFLRRGAAAFVGSLWEVRDKSAAQFAEAFYQALADGKNLGEAMRQARQALRPGDPTYLAYTLYGNPSAVLQ